MSSYLIFVLVLTAVYIIYYAVIVTKDLYGKKDDAKTTEEVLTLVIWLMQRKASP